MRTTFYYIIVLSIFLAGCTSLSNKEKASVELGKAWDISYITQTQLPTNLKVRYNPSKCDENLKYEANIYGHFRHVELVGSKSEMAQLDQEAQRYRFQEIFTYTFWLTNTLYTSACGQQHFVLKLSE